MVELAIVRQRHCQLIERFGVGVPAMQLETFFEVGDQRVVHPAELEDALDRRPLQ